MKKWCVNISLIVVLVVCGFSQAVDLLEDFESYTDTADLTSVWMERNPEVVTLSLETTEAKDGSQSMIIDYNCHNSPYWSEAYTIFDSSQDWSDYQTLNVWIKGYDGDVPGREPNQSLECMYAVVYAAKEGYPNPTDHSQLDMRGKVKVYRVTQVADWTRFRFNIGQNFEPISEIRALGIGMSPEYYGAGIVKLDAISLEEKSYGGIINNFEQYADTNALQASQWINTTDNSTISIEANDPNLIDQGDQSLKLELDNGVDPWYSKVSFSMPKYLKYAWGPANYNSGMNYNPLTINFKVVDPEGKLQVVLIGSDSQVKATYLYDDGNRITAGDWIRWDIDPTTVYEGSMFLTELDSIMRVEIQVVPIDGDDYGTGLIYFDDVHVNNCADGADYTSPTGNLRGDLTGDCVSDFSDFVAFAEYWGATDCGSSNEYCGGADFLRGSGTPVRDGVVDLSDLLILTYRWLDCNMLFQGDCF